MTNRGVYPPLGVPEAEVGCEGFDAYCATVRFDPDALFEDLHCLMDSAGFSPIEVEGHKAKYYARARLLQDPKGHQLILFKSGGSNPFPHVECNGYAAFTLAKHLREHYDHRPTRIDHKVDVRLPVGHFRTFDELHEWAKPFCKRHGLKLSYGGDWATPNAGRTIYIGSRTSQLFVRIYEKGFEYANKLGLFITDELREWVRFEIEFKPQTKVAKALAPTIEGSQIWGSAIWPEEIATEVLSMVTQTVSIRERRESDRDRALRFCFKQYGAHLRALYEELGADPEVFGAYVATRIGMPLEGTQEAA